ncbi:Ada metal-binding domain-containing protein [Heyndrickxia sporothermodurans]
MWEATLSCDPTYGGIFFYAVKKTGFFCRSSCTHSCCSWWIGDFIRNLE